MLMKSFLYRKEKIHLKKWNPLCIQRVHGESTEEND